MRDGAEEPGWWLAAAEAAAAVEASDELASTESAAAVVAAPVTEAPATATTIRDRSPYLTTCPYFRSVDDDARLGPPIEDPDPANRCAAFGDPKPQSTRQQQLVCLTRAHRDCPRFVRGTLAGGPPADVRPPARTFTRATLAAVVVLALSAGASFGFVVVRGGLTVPLAPGPTQVAAAATGTPAPSAPPTAQPTPPPTPRPTPAGTPTPSAPPAATPSPPPPTATPRPPTPPPPTPRPTSSRYALLDPCPNRPDCWIYTVRSGDNLFSIANYFGHSLDTVYRLNPWTRTTPLRAGQQLILPPPTR